MNRPVILVICGKSSVGKDTLAKWLKNNLAGMNIKSKVIVSDTTRPQRDNEKNGVDYNFISENKFLLTLSNREYAEWTNFRGWYYGTPKKELNNDINIVVLNPRGLRKIIRYQSYYQVIPIYLQEKLINRLRRSRDREGKWKLEYFRRAFVDWVDFWGIKNLITSFPKYIILKNEDGVVRKTRKVLFALQQFKVISG